MTVQVGQIQRKGDGLYKAGALKSMEAVLQVRPNLPYRLFVAETCVIDNEGSKLERYDGRLENQGRSSSRDFTHEIVQHHFL